ncbi:MAG: hypothetical protein ACK552_08725 [Microcystis sp.]|jgi:hypothetical protein|nr:hypothetical protein [Microcystis aeruginosa LG13-12]
MKEENKKRKKIKVTRYIIDDHVCLNSIALNQLSQAKEEEAVYQFRWIIPSMAFSVFRVESLCNIYGSHLFPHWDHFESTSFIGKVVMISEFLNIKVDFSVEPWQTISSMKRFRNMLVHAKPQKASVTHEVPEDFPQQLLPLPESKKTITYSLSIENAERFNEVAYELELLWMDHAYRLGFEVNMSGRPKYELEDV